MAFIQLSTARAETNLLDASFQPGMGASGGFVESTLVQPDSKILICGNFTSFGGQPKRYIARLNANGSIDTGFNSEVGYWVRSMALQLDGRIVIGGFFTTVSGVPRNRIARLNSNGSLDTTFDPGTGCNGRIVEADPTEPYVFAVALQPDGKIVAGGNFTTFNSVPRSGLVRLNDNGSVDSTFNIGTGMNSWVRSLMVQSNGQIMVSGWFTSYDNRPYNRMVLLNTNGLADTTFNPYFGDQTAIYSMVRQNDGKIIVSGHSINPSSPFRQEVVRLNLDGTYDSTFNPGGAGANEKVESVVLQQDGKFIIAGYFNTYNGISCGHIVRLNADGTFDRTLATVDNWVWTIVLQTDQRIVFCGGFATVNGEARSGIARLVNDNALNLVNARKSGNVFSVALRTEAGRSYTLQYKGSITETSWTSLPTVIGDGTQKQFNDNTPQNNSRFYRIMQN